MNENIIKVIAMIKLEDELSKNLEELTGEYKQITINDITRKIRNENPELLKEIREAIGKMDSADKQSSSQNVNKDATKNI